MAVRYMTRHTVAIPHYLTDYFRNYKSIIFGIEYNKQGNELVGAVGLYLVPTESRGLVHIVSFDRRFPRQSDFSQEARKISNDSELLKVLLLSASID